MLKTKESKGITLIALVITIIVLLILAGVTINAISGNESAMGKAQEATQKTDISNAKEDCILTAITAKTNAYQASYVDNNATKTIAQTVIDALKDKNNTQNGSASIEVANDGTVTISTTDYEVTGTVDSNGTLAFGEVESALPGIKLSSEALSIEPGKTDTLTVTFKKIPDNTAVTWTSSDQTNKITVSNGTVSVNSSVANGTTATITAKVTYNGTDYTKTCLVKAEKIVKPIGEYVEYGVSYTDMYVSDIDTTTTGVQQFTSENGWRILDAGTKNADGSWSNVKLISTGIPAKLYYHRSQASDGQTIIAGDKTTQSNVPSWWGTKDEALSIYNTDADKTKINKGFVYDDDSSKSGYPNYYAATGMELKFEQIPFTTTTAVQNKGQYKAINNGTVAEGEVTGAIFKTSEAESVSMLTESQLNSAKQAKGVASTTDNALEGLFYLKGLTKFNYDSGYPMYWLASPSPSKADCVKDVNSSGTISIDSGHTNGVRPVVSLKSNVKIEKNPTSGRWEIK